MKNTLLGIVVVCICFSCEYLPRELTNEEVINGLRQALTIGSENAANLASEKDKGFWQNELIHIPLPPEAEMVKSVLNGTALAQATLTLLGFNQQLIDFEKSLNNAAEIAAKGAFEIFANAVKGMTIADGFAILRGDDDAATQYLRLHTTEPLTNAFMPIVASAIAEVKIITDFWNPIIGTYNTVNALPFVNLGEPVNPNLDEYVTGKAIDGLMKLIEIEELKIRTDPLARVTPLLRRVFGQ